MTMPMQEPGYVDEPREAKGYADMLTRVSMEQRAVVVRRDGAELAAIVPLHYLESLHEAAAMEEIQRALSKVDLAGMAKENPPPQEWFDRDEPKPF